MSAPHNVVKDLNNVVNLGVFRACGAKLRGLVFVTSGLFKVGVYGRTPIPWPW